MHNLSDYLKKFSRILFDSTGKVQLVQKVIEETTSIKLGEAQISIKGRSVYIQASPVQKNLLYISKGKILRAIKDSGIQNITEIR